MKLLFRKLREQLIMSKATAIGLNWSVVMGLQKSNDLGERVINKIKETGTEERQCRHIDNHKSLKSLIPD